MLLIFVTCKKDNLVYIDAISSMEGGLNRIPCCVVQFYCNDDLKSTEIKFYLNYQESLSSVSNIVDSTSINIKGEYTLNTSPGVQSNTVSVCSTLKLSNFVSGYYWFNIKWNDELGNHSINTNKSYYSYIK